MIVKTIALFHGTHIKSCMREADISTKNKGNFSQVIQNRKSATLVLQSDRFLLMSEKQYWEILMLIILYKKNYCWQFSLSGSFNGILVYPLHSPIVLIK